MTCTPSNPKPRRWLRPVAAAVVALLSGAAQAQARASLEILPTLGGNSSRAYGLSDSGLVVGVADVGGVDRAFKWLPGAGMEELPTFGSGASWARDSIGVGLGIVGGVQAGGLVATAWINGQPTSVPGVSGTPSLATDIADNGQRVVGWSRIGAQDRAFMAGVGNTVADLGHLGGGSSQAWGVNNGFQVVGQSFNGTAERAFLWQAGSGMLDLGHLGGGGSRALGINNPGQVVGASSNGSAERAFLWQAGAGMVEIGAGLSGSSAANAINDAGLVVGRWSDAGAQGAFVWKAGGSRVDLATLTGAGFSPLDAADINRSAQIVGHGAGSATGGATRGFALTLHPDWVGGSGSWNEGAQHWNWAGTGTAAIAVGSMHDVVIAPAQDVTVTGTASGFAHSLRVGGTVGAVATLDLAGGSTSTETWEFASGGVLRGSGQLQGRGSVASGGRISAGPDDVLQLGTVAAQAGMVEVRGAAGARSSFSVIAGTRNLAGGSMQFEHAEVTLAGGTVNEGLMVLGTATQTSFHQVLQNDGELQVAAGSLATAWGPVSGEGRFSGRGMLVLEGGLDPGREGPGELAFETDVTLNSALALQLDGTSPGSGEGHHDKLVFDGAVTLLDTLLEVNWSLGRPGQAGDHYDLFDWNGGVIGRFASVTLPTLDEPGLTWDTSDLYTSGVLGISAVPEPRTWAMWLAGLCWLVRRSR